MNWYQHPDVINRLAASYVVGTLQGRAKRRFETGMRRYPAIATAVHEWAQRFLPLSTALPQKEVSKALWVSIEKRIGTSSASVARAGWWRSFSPIPLGTMVLGLLVGSFTTVLWQAQRDSMQEMQLPQSYVGVLATQQGLPGLVVSSLRYGKTVDVKQIAAVVVPDGRVLHLWRIDKNQQATWLGPIPQEKFAQIALQDTADKVFFTAVELAVSIEQSGSTPAQPTQPFVYRGLCGKIWK